MLVMGSSDVTDAAINYFDGFKSSRPINSPSSPASSTRHHRSSDGASERIDQPLAGRVHDRCPQIRELCNEFDIFFYYRNTLLVIFFCS
jgi:hypothetical protein